MQFPVACTPGQDCWLVQYMDHDPGGGARDYACGKRVYDGHKGTDIGVRNEAAMRRGVDVLAAAPGTVRGLRDGVQDREYREEHRNAVKGQECGNGVLIDHGNGWVSQYCHLRQGSVAVRNGERVAAGQRLGQVGMSGQAGFPHMHFEVRHDGNRIDPFTGTGQTESCGLGANPLWAPAALPLVAYSPVDIFAVGFAGEAPKPASVRAGRLDGTSLPRNAGHLVVWADLYGVRDGDRLRVRLVDPEGKAVVDQSIGLKRDQIRYFHFVGRRLTDPEWAPGRYQATVELERTQDRPLTRRATATLTVE